MQLGKFTIFVAALGASQTAVAPSPDKMSMDIAQVDKLTGATSSYLQRLSLSGKGETRYVELIYTERNFMNNLGIKNNVLGDSGVGKQTRRIIDSYGNEMAKFLDDAMVRLDFCNDQLTSARKDFETALKTTRGKFPA
ncbi:hypothetical protein EDB80DRAFT_686315 [Ilyonectria destructans]|nr:hypothetical protein EDB80DRAFT_686315 [Ilyonectria destructans]